MLPLVMSKGAPIATLKMDKCRNRTTDECHWRLLPNVTHCGSDVTFGKWSPHVAEDELVFVDAQGKEVGRGDVRVELRDEQGNINRNYEYVFDEEVEMIGRILKAQELPVTRTQAVRVRRKLLQKIR